MFTRAILAVAALPTVPRKVRWVLLKTGGVHAAAWNIGARCVFTGPDVTIGRGTYINRGCLFDASAPITIGERCAIGMDVMLVTSTHQPGDHACRAGELDAQPVTVGDGCWIGARAIILPGVTVGAGTIIGAGAIVTRDCEPDMFYAGAPARAIRPATAR